MNATSALVQIFQKLAYDASHCGRSQMRKGANRTLFMESNKSALLLEKFNQYPKSTPESGATGLQNPRAQNSTPSCHLKLRQLKMPTNVRPVARAITADEFGYEQHRPASTLVARNEDTSQTAWSGSSFVNTQAIENAHHNIREHLKQWKINQDSTRRSVPPSKSISLFWSHDTLNTISQLGLNDEDYLNIDFKDELDEVSRVRTGFTESVVDAMTPQFFLRPGDLVDINVKGNSIVAIVVSIAYNIVTSYTERGTWHKFRTEKIEFYIPNLMSSQDVSGLLAYVEASDEKIEFPSELQSVPIAPRDAGSILVAKMAQFLRSSDAVFRNYAERINRAYEILSHDKPGGQSSISLEDAALRILEKKDPSDLTPPMLLVIHRTLERSQNILRNKVYQRINPGFKLLPQVTLTRLNVVREWVREFQQEKMRTVRDPSFYGKSPEPGDSVNPLAKFAVKARRIISSSRQNRPLSSIGTVGPSSTEVKLDGKRSATRISYENYQESFDQDDQLIIGFLAAWSLSQHMNKASNLASLGPTILRATEMYHDMPLDRVVGCTMLQEMGIVAPWERPALFESHLELPRDDLKDPTSFLQGQAHQSLPRLSCSLNDSMSEYRRSWSDSTVLCIDNSGTDEVDDGISLEPIEGDESLCWVHIHIANPSAFLSKDSPVAYYARHVGSSVFFPENKYPMIEPELSGKYFSLASGRPCITFSAKVSAEGDVFEKSITHGTLSDVRHITLEDVMQALEHEGLQVANEDQMSFLRVGSDSPPFQLHESLSEMSEHSTNLHDTDKDTLRKLYRLSKVLEFRRIRNGALPQWRSNMQRVFSKVSIPGEKSRVPTLHTHQSRHLVGDPVISIHRPNRGVTEAQYMVSEFMLLAGQICATWCSERNIPILYRGIVRNPDPWPKPEVYRRDVLDLSNQTDIAFIDKFFRYKSLLGSLDSRASPLEHSLMGLPAYCKATSPLRRYGDLFNHWQIEAAIRHEHASGKSLIGNAPELFGDSTILPFSHCEVDRVARRVLSQEKQLNAYSRNAENHWITQALYRAFYFQEAPLPAQYEILVREVPEDWRQLSLGYLTALGMSVHLDRAAASDREGGFRINDVWEGKLVHVNPLRPQLTVEPLRLLQRR